MILSTYAFDENKSITHLSGSILFLLYDNSPKIPVSEKSPLQLSPLHSKKEGGWAPNDRSFSTGTMAHHASNLQYGKERGQNLFRHGG
jgi:hypothetical protein